MANCLSQSVFRQISDACFHRVAGMPDHAALSVDFDAARCRGCQSKQSLREFAATRADQSVEADNFTSIDLKIDRIAAETSAADTSYTEPRGVSRAGGLSVYGRCAMGIDRASDHREDEARTINLPGGPRPNALTIAQNGDSISQL